MYYIQRPKISLKYAFFQEQCLVFSRDMVFAHRYSLTEKQGFERAPLFSSGLFGDGFNQIAGTANGPHVQAEGAQPDGKTPNRSANRTQGDLPDLAQLPASLIEREREEVCKQGLIGAIVRIRLKQWDEDTHPIGRKLLHGDDIGLTREVCANKMAVRAEELITSFWLSGSRPARCRCSNAPGWSSG